MNLGLMGEWWVVVALSQQGVVAEEEEEEVEEEVEDFNASLLLNALDRHSSVDHVTYLDHEQ